MVLHNSPAHVGKVTLVIDEDLVHIDPDDDGKLTTSSVVLPVLRTKNP